MIVSAVADPTAFGLLGITDELSKREAIAFLNGIIDNGVLLDEPTRGLLRQSLLEVSQLSTKLGQRIQLLLVEIQKQHKKFVVACDRARWNRQNPRTIVEQCSVLATTLKADVVITQIKNSGQIIAAVGSAIEVVVITEASESRFEITRRRLCRIDHSLDQLDAVDVEEIVGRAVKYASTLRFFDYRMIASIARAKKYFEGIHFISVIWQRWCVVGDANSRSIELYTVGNTHSQSGFLSGAEAHIRLSTLIQVPLNAAVSASVMRFVKEDNEPNIFHTRGFEARSRAFTLDPGFDAIGVSGPVRRCLLKADAAADSHFAECRKLRDLT